jgi:hypothetical protein
VNIGSDLQGFDLPNARLVSIFASLGLIANIQVSIACRPTLIKHRIVVRCIIMQYDVL